jgi:LPS O-antigen subunit length determinant protein (WzzB/FepE family)
MKYYREIETYLKEMREFLFSQYSMMMATCDENQDQDTLNEFVRIIRKYPREKKKEAAGSDRAHGDRP